MGRWFPERNWCVPVGTVVFLADSSISGRKISVHSLCMFTNLQYESFNPTLCRIECTGGYQSITVIYLTEVMKKVFPFNNIANTILYWLMVNILLPDDTLKLACPIIAASPLSKFHFL